MKIKWKLFKIKASYRKRLTEIKIAKDWKLIKINLIGFLLKLALRIDREVTNKIIREAIKISDLKGAECHLR